MVVTLLAQISMTRQQSSKSVPIHHYHYMYIIHWAYLLFLQKSNIPSRTFVAKFLTVGLVSFVFWMNGPSEWNYSNPMVIVFLKFLIFLLSHTFFRSVTALTFFRRYRQWHFINRYCLIFPFCEESLICVWFLTFHTSILIDLYLKVEKSNKPSTWNFETFKTCRGLCSGPEPIVRVIRLLPKYKQNIAVANTKESRLLCVIVSLYVLSLSIADQ